MWPWTYVTMVVQDTRFITRTSWGACPWYSAQGRQTGTTPDMKFLWWPSPHLPQHPHTCRLGSGGAQRAARYPSIKKRYYHGQRKQQRISKSRVFNLKQKNIKPNDLTRIFVLNLNELSKKFSQIAVLTQNPCNKWCFSFLAHVIMWMDFHLVINWTDFLFLKLKKHFVNQFLKISMAFQMHHFFWH